MLGRPQLAVTSVCLCSTCDSLTFDQNWHHLYSSSAGGKDLFNDTQIRVIAILLGRKACLRVANAFFFYQCLLFCSDVHIVGLFQPMAALYLTTDQIMYQ